MNTQATPTTLSGQRNRPEPPVAVEVLPQTDPHQPTASDLADVMAAFTAATERLQHAHTTLQAEVARLKGELRETNAKLRRSRELAALGQMAAGIAHEVRNPLGSIRLYASMLAEDLELQQSESGTLAQRIVQAVDDLDVFVSDVLDFSKEMRIRPISIEPMRLLQDAVATCTPLCREGQQIVIDDWNAQRETSAPDFIADPVLLQQALVNMIRNGLEATERAGGQVVCRVHFTLTCADDWSDSDRHPTPSEHEREVDIPTFTFEIADNGVGLSDECLDSMYNPFFTTKASGTGLGLSIAHKIVEAHGGELEIANSRHGPGAIGRIRLRCNPPADTSVNALSRSRLIREEVCE